MKNLRTKLAAATQAARAGTLSSYRVTSSAVSELDDTDDVALDDEDAIGAAHELVRGINEQSQRDFNKMTKKQKAMSHVLVQCAEAIDTLKSQLRKAEARQRNNPLAAIKNPDVLQALGLIKKPTITYDADGSMELGLISPTEAKAIYAQTQSDLQAAVASATRRGRR